MNTKQHVIFGVALAVSIITLPINAQNPLRQIDQDDFRYSEDSGKPVYRAQVEQAVRQGDFRMEYSNEQSGVFDIDGASVEPQRDESVVLTAYEKLPEPNQRAERRSVPAVLGSTVDEGWQDPKRIVDLIMKISLNLVFVLSFAFGILLIAKRIYRPKLAGAGVERVKSDSLSILQTLQLDSKITIRLVQWRSNRFMVSCDQNGIQSVNPLNASFDQTLKELEKEEDSEEQLVRKLLAGLESGRA